MGGPYPHLRTFVLVVITLTTSLVQKRPNLQSLTHPDLHMQGPLGHFYPRSRPLLVLVSIVSPEEFQHLQKLQAVKKVTKSQKSQKKAWHYTKKT